MFNKEELSTRIANLLDANGCEIKQFETGFFLLKENDEIYEITIRDNIDPGAWED